MKILLRTLVVAAIIASTFNAAPLIASARPSAALNKTVDSQTALSEFDARAVAMQFGHEVEVASATTPTEITTALPDGTFRYVSSAVPVRVQSKSGWVPVNTQLETSGEMVAPVAAAVPVQFSAGGSGPLARIQSSTGEWLEETSPFGELPAPIVSGSVALYEEVLPGVDLQLTATQIGMSEVLIVKSPQAAANPELSAIEFEVTGATITANPAGGATATLSDGSKLRSSTPTWWDSSNGSNASASNALPGTAPVSTTVSGATLIVNANAVVAARDLTYPVYIDPDWTGLVSSFWYIDQAYPSQSYLNGNQAGGEQRVGKVSAANSPDAKNHLARAFWKMTLGGIAQKHVLSAQFNIVETWAFNCTPSGVTLWSTSGTAPGATWNGTGSVYATALDTQTVAYKPGCGGPAAVGFNALSAVQTAAASSAPDITFAIRAANETTEQGWKRFQFGAALVITYNSYPGVPSALNFSSPVRDCGATPAAAAWVSNGAPITMSAIPTDADGNVMTRFYVSLGTNLTTNALPSALAANGYMQTAAAASGVAQSTVIPAGTLTDGLYAWRTVGWDGADVSTTSAWCYFQVKSVPPVAPILVSRAAGPYKVGQATTVRFGGGSSGSTYFAYWWAYDGATSPAAPAPALSWTPNLVCDSGIGAVRIACPAADGTSAVITVAPVAQASVLWVASFDKAGNFSTSVAIPYSGSDSASRDTVKISFGQGHGWPTVDSSAPLTSPLMDSNTNAGTGLTSALPFALSEVAVTSALADPTVAGIDHPVIETRDLVPLNQYIDTDGSTIETVGSVGAPAGATFQTSLGWILPPTTQAPPSTNPIWRCISPYWWNDDYITTDPNCEGYTTTSKNLIGYMWSDTSALPAGMTAIDVTRCGHTSASVGYDESCGPEFGLGYSAAGAALTTAGPGIDTTSAFTASAWLKPVNIGTRTAVALSQSGATNAGYTLGIANGKWQFCVRPQTSTGVEMCAVSAVGASTGTWAFVTGVYDPANSQVRIFVGDSANPSSTTFRPAVSGEANAAGPMVLAAALGNGGPRDPWIGQISHPTVFPGVADKLQRSNLYFESLP